VSIPKPFLSEEFLTMTALFEKLRMAEAEAETKAEQEYRLLVARLASGTDDPLERVQEILHNADRSASDLERDVSLAQRRQAWRQQLADAQAANEQRPNIQEKIDKANAELEAARQKHAETLWPLHQEIQQANTLTAQAADAERQLRETCPDQKLLDRQRHNNRQRQENSQALQSLRDRLETQQSALAVATGRGGGQWVKNPTNINPGDAAIYSQRINRLTAEIAALQEKQTALASEADEIAKAILEA
jgi:hypothetical protein